MSTMPNTHYNNLPRLQIISSLSNIPMLSGPDVEKNLLNHVDFNYYQYLVSNLVQGSNN